MGLRTGTADDLHSEITRRRRRQWNRFLDPTMVILLTEQPLQITVHVPIREGDEQHIILKCALLDEEGRSEVFSFGANDIEIVERTVIDDVPHLKISVILKTKKEIGYYDLDLLYMSSSFGMTGHAKVIITPDSCYIPDRMESVQTDAASNPQQHEKSKTWGLCVNLYSLTSARNWGIGDFADLKAIGEWTAALDGGFVGINPLHTLPNRPPTGISPYSPISRLFKNFIYLDMELVPEVIVSTEAQEVIRSTGFQKDLNDLRAAAVIDYEKIALLKTDVLNRAFEYFYDNHYLNNTPRASDFRRYVEAEGELLQDFALFCALQQQMKSDFKTMSWRDWPEDYQKRDSTKVNEFKIANGKAMLYHQYVQWLINDQHGEIFRRLISLGMPIGLYHDLAIGSSDGGFDTWIARDIMADGIDVGAPPDDFNPSGQNWGFPPVVPEKIRESGYEFLIQTIRKNMRYAGALRIDHALGMFRLFWIPGGMKPEHGTYVKYPSEEILRIIALESVRNRAMVIAEDLGTVGEDVRETLFRFRMLSYKLLYFERNYPDPSYKMPARYSDLALCAVTTHDLPTLYGYWAGRDIEAKSGLGLYPGDELRQRQISERLRDKRLMLQALKSEGLLPETFSDDPSDIQVMISTLCLTIYEFLARTPCKLLAVSLDDIIGTMDQQNMPGTIDTYPNWVQKMPVPIEKIMLKRSFPALAKLLTKNHR
jgi:4-alpha-glucanotransferase